MSRARELSDALDAAASAGAQMVHNGTIWVPSRRLYRPQLVINGAQEVDQRNESASVTVNSSTVTWGVDRFYGQANGGGAFTMQQKSDGPADSPFYTRITTTTAAASPSSGHYYAVRTTVEGRNWRRLRYGSSAALPLTFQIRLRASAALSLPASIQNNAADRSYPVLLTIAQANTWEDKYITIPGDQAGTWLTTNGTGVRLTLDLGSHSGFYGTANAWAGATYLGASGGGSIIGTLSRTLDFTLVDIREGDIALPFEWNRREDEERLCERYYEKNFAAGTAPVSGLAGSVDRLGAAWSTGNARFREQYRTPKRATPSSIVFYPSSEGGTAGQWVTYNGAWNAGTVALQTSNANEFSLDVPGTYTAFTGVLARGNWTSLAEIT